MYVFQKSMYYRYSRSFPGDEPSDGDANNEDDNNDAGDRRAEIVLSCVARCGIVYVQYTLVRPQISAVEYAAHAVGYTWVYRKKQCIKVRRQRLPRRDAACATDNAEFSQSAHCMLIYSK